jgi:hypothetical protein
MSTTGVGIGVALDGPLPVAPPQSLLNTPGVVVAEDATRVLGGANVWMYPTGCSELWEPCSDGTYRVKSDESTQITQRFDSFVVYKSITCSAFGMSDLTELSRRATRVLDATLSAGVERALAEGVDGSSNPFFGDANVTILNSGTAVPPRHAVSYLEQTIGLDCRRGIIHMTPASIAGLPAPFDDTEGTLRTANGTPVVSGMGYQGIDTAALGTPGATQDWAFATLGVQVYLGPVQMTTPKESLDREINEVTFRAEKYVLAVWDGIDNDTLSAAAVLVDWAT